MNCDPFSPTKISPAAYVEQAAELLHLPLANDHRAGVIANLERLAATVGPLLEFALPPELEAAPVFEP